ncbi:MAG: selenium-dependent molybdenum cofactor biosynthesis protein YqeB [Thermoleophilia bacterium]|nr:selenium-dependent molybdenum cofactor biosynthesis protein YqeB [Thermoleophilia bacterium]
MAGYEAGVKEDHPNVRNRPLVLIRGAGDLASGVALRLQRAGFDVVMTEIDRPAAVRRTVAFAEAVYEGRSVVEGLEGVLVSDARQARAEIGAGRVAVLVDPDARVRHDLSPLLLVDAIIAKRNLGTTKEHAPVVVALGPGFVAGEDVHAVVETMRGHTLGRVLYEGEALPNTGVPGEVGGKGAERVLRAPAAGRFTPRRRIGDTVVRGDVVGLVDGRQVVASIDGVLRGLVREGLEVTEGFKVGDVDPRATREHCFTVSDKALAVAGGVLEAACFLLGGPLLCRWRRLGRGFVICSICSTSSLAW